MLKTMSPPWKARDQDVVRLGFIVPSSNTAMEPIITSMIQDINKTIFSKEMTVHFSRFRVTQIALGGTADQQFELSKMLEAAALLADAKVDAIAWGGTSAGWLGFDRDESFVRAITENFGVPAFTSTLALATYLEREEAEAVGLITPYTHELNQAIVTNFQTKGVHIIPSTRPLSITDNIQIGKTTQWQLTNMIEQILRQNKTIGFVTVFCTNLLGAQWAADWENNTRARNIVILDSVSILLWDILRSLDLQIQDTDIAIKWGSLFGSHFQVNWWDEGSREPDG